MKQKHITFFEMEVPCQQLLQFMQPLTCVGEEAKVVPCNNLNIGCVELNWLADTSGLLTEKELSQCKNCGSYINIFSKIGEGRWTCDFCGSLNKVEVLKIPQFPSTLLVEKEQKTSEGNKPNDGIVFCIDISGSMDATIMDPKTGDNYTILDNGDKGFHSAWDILKIRILNLLDQVEKDYPSAIVGFVFFAEFVQIYGDGMQQSPLTISPSSLKQGKSLFSSCADFYEYVKKECKGWMQTPIRNSKLKLIQILKEVKFGKQTALGPAIFASRCLIRELNRESKVFVFSDGMANEGFGSIDGINPDIGFYEEDLPAIFANKGNVLSYFEIHGANCGLKYLKKTVDLSGGEMKQLELLKTKGEIKISFSPSIARNVELNVILPKILQETNVGSGSNLCYKTAEVKRGMVHFFEYELANGINRKNLPNELHMQVQIKFIRKGKSMLRVATQKIKLIHENLPFEYTNYKMISKYAGHLTDVACKADNHLRKNIYEKLNHLVKAMSIVQKEHLNAKKRAERSECIETISKLLIDPEEQDEDDIVLTVYKLRDGGSK